MDIIKTLSNTPLPTVTTEAELEPKVPGLANHAPPPTKELTSVPTDPADHSEARLLTLISSTPTYRITAYAFDPARGFEELERYDYFQGDSFAIEINTLGIEMFVSLEGKDAANPLALAFSQRAFWIGYVLFDEDRSELRAFISDLTILER